MDNESIFAVVTSLPLPVLAGNEIHVYTEPRVALLSVTDNLNNLYTRDPKEEWITHTTKTEELFITATFASWPKDGKTELKVEEWHG